MRRKEFETAVLQEYDAQIRANKLLAARIKRVIKQCHETIYSYREAKQKREEAIEQFNTDLKEIIKSEEARIAQEEMELTLDHLTLDYKKVHEDEISRAGSDTSASTGR